MVENKTKIGLLIIATNKYIEFLQNLLDSADIYFLNNLDVTYFIFTNKDISFLKSKRNIVSTYVEHEEWPWMTLGRYQIFTNNSNKLSNMDYLYYCDADMKFLSEVGIEIIGDLVATQHPGFYGKRGSPESNIKSLAYVGPDEEMQYFAGGFNGGRSSEYLKMSDTLSKNIENDFMRLIIATWHDESHLNRYLINNPPTKILTPSYCYGEDMELPFDKKIIALSKKHSDYRENPY